MLVTKSLWFDNGLYMYTFYTHNICIYTYCVYYIHIVFINECMQVNKPWERVRFKGDWDKQSSLLVSPFIQSFAVIVGPSKSVFPTGWGFSLTVALSIGFSARLNEIIGSSIIQMF
jgi:hypothetical protein